MESVTATGLGGGVSPSTGTTAAHSQAYEQFMKEFKLQMTTDGFPVRKMTSKGKAVPRLLKLSADFDVLSWPTKSITGTTHSFKLADIQEVETGIFSKAKMPTKD